MLYDVNGKPISTGGTVSSADIKTALIGAVADGSVNLGSSVGATLAYTSPGTDWETYANTAYQNLLTAYKAVPNSGIPFFISTDQHGRGVEVNRWMNNADVDGMDVLNINLGDTVIDTFGIATMNDILARTWQIKNFVSVVGNHEFKGGAEPVNSYDINRTFITTMDEVKAVSPLNCYSIVEGSHNYKIMVVDTNIIGTGQGLTTAVADWIIAELKGNDGKDIVWLNHWPVFDSCKQRDDAEETTEGLNTISGGTAVQFAIWEMLLDRKNKASGTYTDIEGVVHSYDFSDCEGDLLCCLHGHIHTEWYTTARGLTAYAAPMCGDTRTCTFGLIDRLNSKVTFWVFDSTGCLDHLELPI
jgi:hypothetical protein